MAWIILKLCPPPHSVEKLYSTKLVPGTKKVRDCYLYLCQHLLSDFDSSHSSECFLIVVLMCNSLKSNNVEHLFMCFLAIHVSFLEKYVFRYFAYFLKLHHLSYCEVVWVFLLNHFLLLFYYSCPNFPPLLIPTPTHSQFPHCCPFPYEFFTCFF